MKIVSTFHASSSLVSSIKCKLSSQYLEHLVVAKPNRVDVYSLQPHGLQHLCGLDVMGRICTVKAIPILADNGCANILLMLAPPEPELMFIAYKENEAGQPRLSVEKRLSLFEGTPRLAEFFTDVVLHPSGQLAVVSCYASKLKIITLNAGKYVANYDVSIPETNLFSLAFLPVPDNEIALAMLYHDSEERIVLRARDILLDGDIPELSLHYSFSLQPTIVTNKVVPYPIDMPPMLIPVSPVTDNNKDLGTFIGGVFVVGGKQIMLYERANKESQQKQAGKKSRLDAKKKASSPTEVAAALAKEHERDNRVRKPKASVEWPWDQVSTWCHIDRTRILLCDVYGRIAMLSMENLENSGLVLIPLGEISQPKTLTYLTNQLLYVGSHCGDSQLVQISSTPAPIQEGSSLTLNGINSVSVETFSHTRSKKGKERAANDMNTDDDPADYSKGRVITPHGSYINVVETYKNLAPIMDAILVETDGNNQTQIVTCSGDYNSGSVNIVRNGATFRATAFLRGLEDVTNIWSLKARPGDVYDSHVVATILKETHIFEIQDSSSFAHLTSSGLIMKQPTLALSNMKTKPLGATTAYVQTSLVVQVVPTGVFLFEWNEPMQEYVELDKWAVSVEVPPSPGRSREIISASINPTQVALALTDGAVRLISIDGLKLKATTVANGLPEISAISVTPMNENAHFSPFVLVAYWESKVVEIIKLAEGEPPLPRVFRSVPFPAVIRSLVLYNFGRGPSKSGDFLPYLLAGLSDGSIASVQLVPDDLRLTSSQYTASTTIPKIISLGHTPVTLLPCLVDGKRAVFAAGNGATVLFATKERLMNSPVMLRDVVASCSLNTATCPAGSVHATQGGIHFGRIGDLNKTHIKTASLGLDNPHRIVHVPSLKAYAIACTRHKPSRIGANNSAPSSLQLLDESTLSVLGKFICEEDETITSVATITSAVGERQSNFIIAGTYQSDGNNIDESTAGRILLFTAFSNSGRAESQSDSVLELSLMVSTQVKGCVFALRVVEGKIVAAVNSAVYMFKLVVSEDDELAPIYNIRKIAEWKHNYLVTSLGSVGCSVVVGDQISSVSMLEVVEDTLKPVARDYSPLYPVAVEALDPNSLICATDSCSLAHYALADSLRGDTKYLEAVGQLHLSEMVSTFRRGSIATSDPSKDSKFKAELVFFTSSGLIGTIVNVEDRDLSMQLTALERNLAAVVLRTSGMNHIRYRAIKNTRGPANADSDARGFVDGDLLERFLTIRDSPELLQQVMEGDNTAKKLTITHKEIVEYLEQLQSLH